MTVDTLRCDGKEAFGTFELANRVNKRRAAAGHKGNVYRCAVCRQLHIGSVFSSKRKRDRHLARLRRDEELV